MASAMRSSEQEYKPRIEFGADGIRGRLGEWPFISSIAVRIGQALGRFLLRRCDDPTAILGRDTRPSGARLLPCLAAGLVDQGVNAINVGIMTTPGVAFLTRRLQADLGVIVSASHSPLQYNGIKLVRQNGLRLQREDEIEIESLISALLDEPPECAAVLGQETDGEHLIELYIQDHIQRCPVQSLEGLRIVIDCADGAASRLAPEVLRRLGADLFVINDGIEGKSINFECGSEHVRTRPEDLARVVRGHDAAYGFALDGDGDRLVVVDSQAHLFDGHDLLLVLASHFHSQRLLRGDAVVTVHLANRGLAEALEHIGVRTIYTDKGDKNIEAAMWGGDYLLGGEPGGNIIINDGNHTAADAVYTSVVLAGILVNSRGVGLSTLAAPLKRRPQVIKSFELSTRVTLEQRAFLQEEIERKLIRLGQDGRIQFWDSSTEKDVVRVMVEGSHNCKLEEVAAMTEHVCDLIRQAAGGRVESLGLDLSSRQR
jgi:phosphoglucosamine mutase